HVSRDGDRQLRGPFRDSEHAPRVRREHIQRARQLRLFVRQRLLGRHRRDEPLRQREETHHSHQAGGLNMLGLSKPVPASATLRVLAALLGYPDAGVRGYLPEMRAILRRECALSDTRQAELDALIDFLARAEPLEIEAGYVELFDRGRATSLHLFEHVHGDSRDRGPAMVDLAQTYEKAGLYLAPDELLDYLPVLLEFTSTQPPL